MRVKLLKSVIVGSVSNTEATRAGQVVEVDDAEGKELVRAGYAEETSSKVTVKRAEDPANKMAPDATNKEAAASTTGTAPRATTAAGAARTTDTGVAAAKTRGGRRSARR
jgi:hypothetical protein